MINFLQKGNVLNILAPYNTTEGAGVQLTEIFGVANATVLSGANVDVEMRGVFTLAKDTSVFAVGDKVYWDNSAKHCTSTSTSNKLVGAATSAQLTGDGTVNVWLPGIVN